MVFPADGPSSYRVSCYVSHRHASENALRHSLCRSYGGYGPHMYLRSMDLVMVFPVNGVSSYRASSYISHRHASEDAISEMGSFSS